MIDDAARRGGRDAPGATARPRGDGSASSGRSRRSTCSTRTAGAEPGDVRPAARRTGRRPSRRGRPASRGSGSPEHERRDVGRRGRTGRDPPRAVAGGDEQRRRRPAPARPAGARRARAAARTPAGRGWAWRRSRAGSARRPARSRALVVARVRLERQERRPERRPAVRGHEAEARSRRPRPPPARRRARSRRRRRPPRGRAVGGAAEPELDDHAPERQDRAPGPGRVDDRGGPRARPSRPRRPARTIAVAGVARQRRRPPHGRPARAHAVRGSARLGGPRARRTPAPRRPARPGSRCRGGRRARPSARPGSSRRRSSGPTYAARNVGVGRRDRRAPAPGAASSSQPSVRIPPGAVGEAERALRRVGREPSAGPRRRARGSARGSRGTARRGPGRPGYHTAPELRPDAPAAISRRSYSSTLSAAPGELGGERRADDAAADDRDVGRRSRAATLAASGDAAPAAISAQLARPGGRPRPPCCSGSARCGARPRARGPAARSARPRRSCPTRSRSPARPARPRPPRARHAVERHGRGRRPLLEPRPVGDAPQPQARDRRRGRRAAARTAASRRPGSRPSPRAPRSRRPVMPGNAARERGAEPAPHLGDVLDRRERPGDPLVVQRPGLEPVVGRQELVGRQRVEDVAAPVQDADVRARRTCRRSRRGSRCRRPGRRSGRWGAAWTAST